MKKVAPPFLLIALAFASAPSMAADGWFGGLKVAPWVNRADALLNFDRTDPPQRKRPAGTAGAASATRRVEVELGYNDSPADGTDVTSATTARNATFGRNFRLAGVGTWTMGDNVGVTGRVGAYRGNLQMQNAYLLTPDASLHPTYGMGVHYNFSSNLLVQGGWDRYRLGGSLRPGDDGVDLLTIGLKYRF